MLGRKKASAQIDKAVAQSVNYEVSLAEIASRSERRAWFTAAAAILLAMLLAAGYLLMLPLKERTPFLVMADAYTGTARVAKLSSGLSGSNMSANQALNRANLAHYVVTRESYDHDLLRARDWRQVFMMSSPAVGAEYRQQYSPQNPNSPVKLYGKSSSIRANIISITPSGEGWFGKVGGASVRFQRVQVNRTNGSTQILDTRLATILYTYDEDLPLSEEQRFDNPLGFQVTEYRVERELISMPVEPPDAVQQVDAAGAPVQGGVPQPQQSAEPGQAGVPQQETQAVGETPTADMSQPAAAQSTNAGVNNPNGATNR